MEATHKISVVFFPTKLELELTWEDIETGQRVGITTKVPDLETGEKIAKIVPPCVYHPAITRKELSNDQA